MSIDCPYCGKVDTACDPRLTIRGFRPTRRSVVRQDAERDGYRFARGSGI